MKSSKLFFLFLIAFAMNSRAHAATPCLHIYYDKSPDKTYRLGKVYSMYLQNLLGHFPEFQQIISPIEKYKKGDLEKCEANFYIGSYFNNNIPKEFFDDYMVTKKNIAWMGYNIWQMDPAFFEKTFGYTYSHLTTLDTKTDKKGQPGFFRFINYKGEKFEKFGAFVGEPKEFRAGFEMVALAKSETSTAKTEILSTAEHSVSKEKLPYVLRNNNYFFIADVPFSFIHESDRYLVVSDVLFDVLKAKPRHSKKLALMRIEDVHPLSPLPELYRLANVFKEEKIPLHISIVPIFFDPLYKYDREPEQEFLPLTHHAGFMAWLESLKQQETEYIWHGSTHQYGRVANPHTGYSTDDFEFWDAVHNTPIAEDSVNFVLDRLDFGYDYLKAAKIEPLVWLTPHYQASALDYVIFARVFPWNIGRAIYFESKISGLPKDAGKDLYYSVNNKKDTRKEFFKDLKVETVGNWNGQLYPYEIYGDLYGQRMLPESLGNPQPFENAHVVQPRTLKEIVADAKRNLVLRDTWASMFFHPYLLTDLYNDGIGQFPGDTAPLRELLREIKKLGYEFINTKNFIETNNYMRPEPIYIGED